MKLAATVKERLVYDLSIGHKKHKKHKKRTSLRERMAVAGLQVEIPGNFFAIFVLFVAIHASGSGWIGESR